MLVCGPMGTGCLIDICASALWYTIAKALTTYATTAGPSDFILVPRNLGVRLASLTTPHPLAFTAILACCPFLPSSLGRASAVRMSALGPRIENALDKSCAVVLFARVPPA